MVMSSGFSRADCLRPLASARRDNSGFVGEVDELGAVTATELAEDAADVRFGGQWADDELACDLVVGEAGGDQTERLVFALGELLEFGRGLMRIRPRSELGDQPFRAQRLTS